MGQDPDEDSVGLGGRNTWAVAAAKVGATMWCDEAMQYVAWE